MTSETRFFRAFLQQTRVVVVPQVKVLAHLIDQDVEDFRVITRRVGWKSAAERLNPPFKAFSATQTRLTVILEFIHSGYIYNARSAASSGGDPYVYICCKLLVITM